MEFRKNLSKPICVDFRNPNMDFGIQKIKKLNQILKANIFNNNSNNKLDVDQISNLSSQNIITEFPIKLIEINENKKSGLNDKIQEYLYEICEEIHGNLFSKEEIIKSIKEKNYNISKASIANFLKASAMRTTMKKYSRKVWFLNQEILQQANINEKLASEIFEKNVKKYELINEEKKIQGDKISVKFSIINLLFYLIILENN